VYGLVYGLVVVLVVGLAEFGSSANIAQRASSPAESQRGDRRLTVLIVSASGLGFGLAVGLVGGLVGGLVFGLVGGLVGLVDRAWFAFLVASGWLAANRRLPWRLMAFLEDAYRLGLLRVVGSAYQFRHAQLQDHLVHHDQARSGQHPATFEARRARSLTNLAIEHAERGQREEALVASTEAVELYRRLAVASPDTFTTDLTASLTNLGTRLANLGRWEQACAAMEEAVRTCRRVATANPVAFEPQLARTLWAFAWVQAAGRLNTTGALTSVEESVEIYQRLANRSPDAFADDVRAVHRTMAVILDELGRTDEASQIRRQLDGESDTGTGTSTPA
jgi:tetratricopeptide (TPR) repeat protein